MVNTASTKAMSRIGENLEQDVLEAYFNGQVGHLRRELMAGGSTVAMDPSHVVYGACSHIPSSRYYGEWVREPEAVGAEAEGPFESKSRGTTV